MPPAPGPLLGPPLLIPPIPPPPPPPQVAQSGAGHNNTTMKSAAMREIRSLITLTSISKQSWPSHTQKLRHRATVFACVRCALGVKRRLLPALYDRSANRGSTGCLSPSSSSAEPYLCARELLQQQRGAIVFGGSGTFKPQRLALRPLCVCALADPKYVPVRMPHVHLAYVPRHVGRRESNV